MTTTKCLPQLVDDLAAHGTELVLGILSRAGLRISVDAEIETWRSLKESLCAALRERSRHAPRDEPRAHHAERDGNFLSKAARTALDYAAI